MNFGQQISILISGAIAVNAVAVRMAHGTVNSTTDKAIAVMLDTGAVVWFPRKGLLQRGGSYTIAPWLKRTLSEDSWRKLDLAAEISGQVTSLHLTREG